MAKPKDAEVVDLDRARVVKKIRALYKGLCDAEGQILSAQQAAAQRRLELGQLLIEMRGQWPERGPNAKGWTAFLRECELGESAALIAMKYAGFVERFPTESGGKLPTLVEAGLEKPASPATYLDRADGGNLFDRDTWCTPAWIAEAIGDWDLDPCANERSIIQAARELRLERGEDGLVLANQCDGGARVFINPPYSNVTPWIDAYAHTRFCFLLKLDVSTEWFAKLFDLAEIILLPRGTRVEFTAPEGVPPEKTNAQPFPHALFYARAADATPAIRALCFTPWRTR